MNFDDTHDIKSQIIRSQCKEMNPFILVTGKAGSGKSILCNAVADALHMHHYKVSTLQLADISLMLIMSFR